MTRSNSSATESVDEIRDEIVATRAELGDTVEQLAAKADIKSRAQEKLSQVKTRTNDAVASAREKVRGKAQRVADSGRELADEIRSDPTTSAKRAAASMRRSMRDNPRTWAFASGAVAALVLVMAWRRRHPS